MGGQRREMKTRAPGKHDSQLNLLHRLICIPDLELVYSFGRSLDDIADGDALTPADFLNFPQFVDHLKLNLNNNWGVLTNRSRAEILMAATMEKLSTKAQAANKTEQIIARFLDAMVSEYDRRVK